MQAVLSLNPPGAQLHDKERGTVVAREMNDGLVGIIRSHPNRFAGLGTIAPQQPEQAAREVKRIMGPLQLGGVMINSHTHGCYLDEPDFEPILAAAEEENATIYLHPRLPSPQMLDPYKRYGTLGLRGESRNACHAADPKRRIRPTSRVQGRGHDDESKVVG